MTRRTIARAMLTLVAGAALAGAAHAEVKAAAPDGFQLAFAERIAAPPAAVYAAIGQVERWWSPEHTYSGDAANLRPATHPVVAIAIADTAHATRAERASTIAERRAITRTSGARGRRRDRGRRRRCTEGRSRTRWGSSASDRS